MSEIREGRFAVVAPQDAASVRASARLSRGITATWWNSMLGVLMFELALVFVWTLGSVKFTTPAVSVAIGVSGLVWVFATVPLLVDYKNLREASFSSRLKRAIVPLLAGLAYGLFVGWAFGAWIAAATPLVAMAVLLPWSPGLRWRLVGLCTAMLAVLWFIDLRTGELGTMWWTVGFFAVLLPAMSVLALWWWDVVVELDLARASEARLAATQERLRVATDVHDLQGHHLQVIALQLELAERLMGRDDAEAMKQIRLARSSVDAARQGTRDLATQFRSAPLRDELQNAKDLLEAAGCAVTLSLGSGVERAPADVLGAVIREATTNILRHGGGRWARLSLAPVSETSRWRLEISNDLSAVQHSAREGGSGLEGIGRRVAEAGGTIDVREEEGTFAMTVEVPGLTSGGAR